MGFFWSPDNRSIAFISGNKLRKVDVNGGAAVDLCDVPMRNVNASGAWSRDGIILFAPSGMDGLYRTSTSGAPLERVTNVDASRHETHLSPQFFPDGRRYLFTVRSDGGRFATHLGWLDRKETKPLLQEASNAFYMHPRGSSQGYVFFERNMLLMAQRFDEGRQEVTGEVHLVSPKPLTYWRAFSVSANGTIAYRAGNPDTVLVWMDRSGRIVETLPVTGDNRQISLSPDESSLAVGKMEQSRSNVSHIWLIDLKRGTSTRLTSAPPNNFCPVWSPDGRRIVFSSNRDGPMNLYVRASSGDGADEPVLKSDVAKFVSSWSSDGRYLAYWFSQSKTGQDIWIAPSSGGKPFPFLETEFNELQPAFSPDGQWIAYTSDESGRQEVYVRRFEGSPASAGAIRISEDGGAHPKWRRDGRELFYLTPDRRLMSVAIETSLRFHAGRPQPLFQTRISMADFLDNYAVSSDGQHFLVNNSDEKADSGPITVIANWSPGAKR
jgi:Tol biopolymer transport system component